MIQLEVWGENALFTRPEFKVERVSYDVMTPSAARGILDAIYWHPGLKWVIDSIHVCAPIRFMNVRRNEVGNIIPVKKANQARKTGKPLYSVAPEKIEQRSSLILKNVRYIITAHFVMTEAASPTDNPDKFQGITKRRAESGKCYHQPYFGCREFPAFFKLWDGQYSCPQELEGEKDLGYMLFDMDYSNPGNIQPMFFHAEMKNGIIVIPNKDSKEVLR